MLNELKKELKNHSSKDRKEKVKKYFKTGIGDYGEGDIFIGVSMPDIRKCIKPFIKTISLSKIEDLLRSPEHEFRLAALILLVKRYQIDKTKRDQIVQIYITNTDYINNWDLVDSSAHYILGPWLSNLDKTIIYDFAKSGDLWKERIAIMTTLHFIKKDRRFDDTFKISEILLHNRHDLIHKAVGWMLREVGNISIDQEISFLKKHYHSMPRTMLRYAIEKFPEELRQDFLKGRV